MNPLLVNRDNRVKKILKYNHNNLAEFFNLNQPKYGKYEIYHKLEDEPQISKIYIRYVSIDSDNLENYLLIMNNYIGLPIELNPIIANFILDKKYIKLQTQIRYTEDYPFDPPKWYLSAIKSNMFHELDKTDYFENLIELHNFGLQSWSGILHIQQDILNFIVMLNRIIDYLENNCVH